MGFSLLDKIVKKLETNRGGLLLIDYGYLKQKNFNTLQSVKKHKKNQLFQNLGSSDITYLVNFNLLKEYFFKKKLKTKKIVSQSYFLKKTGILKRAEMISKNMNFSQKADLYFRIKRLLDNKQMGSF